MTKTSNDAINEEKAREALTTVDDLVRLLHRRRVDVALIALWTECLSPTQYD